MSREELRKKAERIVENPDNVEIHPDLWEEGLVERVEQALLEVHNAAIEEAAGSCETPVFKNTQQAVNIMASNLAIDIRSLKLPESEMRKR